MVYKYKSITPMLISARHPAHWKKHSVGLGFAFYSLCDLEQVISPTEVSVSSPVAYSLCRATANTGRTVYAKCPLHVQHTTNFHKQYLLLPANFFVHFWIPFLELRDYGTGVDWLLIVHPVSFDLYYGNAFFLINNI